MTRGLHWPKLPAAKLQWAMRPFALALVLLWGLSAHAAPSETHGPASDTPQLDGVPMPELSSELSRMDGGWYTMTYHPSLEAQIRTLAEQADGVRAELRRLLNSSVLSKVDVYVGRTAGEMETFAPLGARFPRYASGVAFSEMAVVLLTATPRYPGVHHDLGEVFRHELAHVAIHDAVGRENVPRWFNEGFAIHASNEASGARLQSLWTATVSQSLIPLSDLSQGFPADSTTASVAYAQAADIVRYLLRSHEEHRFAALVDRLQRGQKFEQALSDAYSTDLFTLEKQWRKDLAQRYTFWPVIFGGSLVWVGAFGLMVAAYVRRRRRATRKLERWAKEEALQDARTHLVRSALGSAGDSRLPVRILVTRGADFAREKESDAQLPQEERETRIQGGTRGSLDGPAESGGPVFSGVEGARAVPTVEYEGERHTLH